MTFAATDAMTGLKLIESGMPKERLALFAVPLVPIQIILPLMISKYTHGPRPMDIFLKAYPYRCRVVFSTMSVHDVEEFLPPHPPTPSFPIHVQGGSSTMSVCP